MTRAYDEVYLDDAMDTLGGALEYAVLFCGMDGDEFLDLFAAGGIADEFGRGNVKFISGLSGIELARGVLERCGKTAPEIKDLPYIDYPPEYWVGWILAYYQWYTGKRFDSIIRKIPYSSILNMYGVLHEADPDKAVGIFDSIMDKEGETNLARIRRIRGLSQSELAKMAGVSVRSVQLYEQRQTDINKAQYNNLLSLARVLGCEIEDILE